MKYLEQIYEYKKSRLPKYPYGTGSLSSTPTFNTKTPILVDDAGYNFGTRKNITYGQLGSNGSGLFNSQKPVSNIKPDVSGNMSNISSGANMAATIGTAAIDNFVTGDTVKDFSGNEYKKDNVWGETGKGALKGAAMGAQIDVMTGGATMGLGAVTGGLIGAGYSAYEAITGNDAVDSQVKEANKRIAAADKGQAINRYNSMVASGYNPYGKTNITMFKKGGKIKSQLEGYSDNVDNFSGFEDNYKTFGLDKGNIGLETWVSKLDKKMYPYLNLNKDIGKNTNINLSLPIPVNGNNYFGFGITKKFAEGGKVTPEYEVEGNEVIQGQGTQLENQENLASDMTKAVGGTHEQGGVKGQGGERVFSDRLYMTPLLYAGLKQMKVRVKPDMTYAEVAEVLGNKKGKFEEKVKSFEPSINKTGNVMLERIDGLIEATFQEQEQQKQFEEMRTYKKALGGYLKKYNTGGIVVGAINPKTGNPYTVEEVDAYTKGTELMPSPFGKEYGGLDSNGSLRFGNYSETMNNFGDNNITTNKNIESKTLKSIPVNTDITYPSPITDYIKPNGTAYKGNPVMSSLYSVNKGLKNTVDNIKTVATSSKTADAVKDVFTTGQTFNALSYLKNLSTIDKMGTNINRTTATPLYRKAPDVFSLAKYNINRTVRDASSNLDKTGNAQDNFQRKAALVSNSVNAINDAANSQAQIDAATAAENTATANRYNTMVAENQNADALDKLQGKNAKLALKQKALNTLIQGIVGNVASDRAYAVDKEKNAIARMDANRGTAYRSAIKLLEDKNLSKETREELETYVNGIEKKKYGGKIGSKMKKAYC